MGCMRILRMITHDAKLRSTCCTGNAVGETGIGHRKGEKVVKDCLESPDPSSEIACRPVWPSSKTPACTDCNLYGATQ